MRHLCPTVADFENVTALNRGFLEFAAGRPRPPAVNESLHGVLVTLSGAERRQMAHLPFLLFSLGGYDPGLWRQCPAGRQRDLLRDEAPMPAPEWQLVASTLSLLWLLARDNRYSARLVAGASDDWYSLVSGQPIVRLLEFAAGFEHLVVPRLADEQGFWRRLVMGCRLPARKSREATKFAAFQRVLTEPGTDRSLKLAAAACRRADAAKRLTGPPGGGLNSRP